MNATLEPEQPDGGIIDGAQPGDPQVLTDAISIVRAHHFRYTNSMVAAGLDPVAHDPLFRKPWTTPGEAA